MAGSSAGSPTGSRAERVEARGQVAVHAVRLDHARWRPAPPGAAPRRRPPAAAGRDRRRRRLGGRRPAPAAVARPRRGVPRRALSKTPLVEAVLALEQLVDPAQERARLGALDHAVVVGAEVIVMTFGDAELPELRRVDLGEPGRVADRAGGDDRALAGHQPRHRRDRADAARVRERDVRALVVVGRQRVVARAGDQLVVAGDEGRRSRARRRRGSPARRASACRPCAPRRPPGPRLDAARASTRCGLPSTLRVGVGHHRHVGGGLRRSPRRSGG